VLIMAGKACDMRKHGVASSSTMIVNTLLMASSIHIWSPYQVLCGRRSICSLPQCTTITDMTGQPADPYGGMFSDALRKAEGLHPHMTWTCGAAVSMIYPDSRLAASCNALHARFRTCSVTSRRYPLQRMTMLILCDRLHPGI
jgi:hypothetical protein